MSISCKVFTLSNYNLQPPFVLNYNFIFISSMKMRGGVPPQWVSPITEFFYLISLYLILNHTWTEGCKRDTPSKKLEHNQVQNPGKNLSELMIFHGMEENPVTILHPPTPSNFWAENVREKSVSALHMKFRFVSTTFFGCACVKFEKLHRAHGFYGSQGQGQRTKRRREQGKLL